MHPRINLSAIQSGVLVTYLGILWFIFGAAKGLGDVGSKKAKAVYEAIKTGTKPARYDAFLVAYLAGPGSMGHILACYKNGDTN